MKACERDRDRTLLLSLGLFGAPAAQAERDRAAESAEKRNRAEGSESRPR